jgi:protoheme IX farnesyltransferase
MLPVTHGAKTTRAHIFAYSLLLAPLALAPVVTGLGGPIYAAIAGLAGVLFVLLAWRVVRSNAGEGDKRADKPARDLFGFSILYLFALFAALLAERGFA